jgi:hypothetical protein
LLAKYHSLNGPKLRIGIGQLVDRETRFDFHKQRGTVVPDTFCRAVTAEEYRRIHIAVEIKPVFFGERFVFQIGIVTDLRSKTGVVATHHVYTLVPPIRQRYCGLSFSAAPAVKMWRAPVRRLLPVMFFHNDATV